MPTDMPTTYCVVYFWEEIYLIPLVHLSAIKCLCHCEAAVVPSSGAQYFCHESSEDREGYETARLIIHLAI